MEHEDWLVDDDGVIENQPVFLRTPYNYDKNLASLQSGLECNDENLAQQQFAEEVDINTIVKRFGLTGQLPTSLRVPEIGDFDQVNDYHTALNMLIEADDAFMQMPADIRERFQNNAGNFVEFVSDEKNREQCKQWGLLRPETPRQAPIEVRVIADPSEPTKTA